MSATARQKGLKRRALVLERMEALGFITAAERQAADASPLGLRPRKNPFLEKAPYPTEKVRRELLDLYGEDLLLRGGLQVETTLDFSTQRLAEAHIDRGLRQLDKRMGWRGAEANLASRKERGIFVDKAKKRYPRPLAFDRIYLALVTRVYPYEADVRVGSVEGIIPIEEMRWAAPYSPFIHENGRLTDSVPRALKEGDVVFVKLAKRQGVNGNDVVRFALEQEPYIQGSIFTYEVESGYVKSYVAGRDYEQSEFDRIAQGCRQPGSTFKPLYYALALQRGMSPETILSDRPKKEIDPVTGEEWVPYNVDGTYLISCSMRTALVQSRNLPSIEVFARMGAPDVVRYSAHLGISTPMIADRALALGASCVHPYDMAKVFGVFARNGERVEPILLKRVRNARGEVLLDRSYHGDPFLSAESKLDRLVSFATTPKQQVIPRKAAFDIGTLLRQVVTGGLATRAQQSGAPAAGKTGTSSKTADLWFLGYTSQFLTEVWIGSDAYERPLGASEQASHVAVPIWTEYMKEFLAGRPQQEIPPPLSKADLAAAPAADPVLSAPVPEEESSSAPSVPPGENAPAVPEPAPAPSEAPAPKPTPPGSAPAAP
jgi:penicillin-binding protein 1A